ncbi:hypothetical protein BGZ83_000233, partial [Gryganskiella cystojenkinii]
MSPLSILKSASSSKKTTASSSEYKELIDTPATGCAAAPSLTDLKAKSNTKRNPMSDFKMSAMAYAVSRS